MGKLIVVLAIVGITLIVCPVITPFNALVLYVFWKMDTK